MASELQRRKVTRVFRAMDANGDGLLEEADFAALTDRWAEIRDTTPGSPEHVRLIVIMMGWWQTLLAATGETARATVTVEDVLAVVDRLGEMRETVETTATTMFDAIDENGDGLISRTEYRRLIEAWNGRSTDTDTIFPLLDLDGDGFISRAEFAELWTEFWSGDDPEAPGTWVFGRFALPVREPH